MSADKLIGLPTNETFYDLEIAYAKELFLYFFAPSRLCP